MAKPAPSASKNLCNSPTLAETPLTELKGVGASMSAKLAALHLHSIQDVLFHLPLRYEDRSRVYPIAGLLPGQRGYICGEVELAPQVKFGKRRSMVLRIADGSGAVTLRFFHFSAAQKAALSVGARLACFGELRRGPGGNEMVHPEYKVLGAQQSVETSDKLTPIYPAGDGVQQRTLRRLVDQSFTLLVKQPERLADYLRGVPAAGVQLPGLVESLQLVHNPPVTVSVAELLERRHPCQRRLAFEELLAHTLSLQQLRVATRRQPAAALQNGKVLFDQLLAQLGFPLTGAQNRVISELYDDLASGQPTLRLVQGDVGSGKTVVAAAALLAAVASGEQAAMMAPTELLAEQHYLNFCQWLEPLGIRIGWVAGRVKGKQRREMLQELSSGDLQIAIGTHALFQADIEFKSLALVVIDEQHRFGVDQRLALRDKGLAANRMPHQITMTATPIPRTLAMSAYADLDVSVIDELPPGRTPVTTVAISEERRADVTTRVRKACEQGRQAYWVCPLIEDSEALQCQAAETTAAQLTEELSGLRVALIHGRMKAVEKQTIMAAFKNRESDLLVATTVIEVGVDVPNASLMIIENAERLGLSQLHQLRGRVGRGQAESSCVLMYKSPLGRMAKSRLSILRETNDGFRIANRDLELRGPGEVLGTRQTGLVTMRVADLLRDAGLLPEVREVAENLALNQPELAERLVDRWLGSRARYGEV